MIRECVVCGKKFEFGVNNNQITCSDECQKKHLNKVHSEYMKKRKLEKHPDVCKCLICGKECHYLSKHISVHKITPEEYMKKFNVTRESLTSKTYFETLSKKNEGKITQFHDKDKNPSTNSKGRNSVFSLNFRKYDGLTEQQKLEKIQIAKDKIRAARKAHPEKYTNTFDYWLNQGLDKVQAWQMLSERQRTFSRQKCIKKLGEKRGIERWSERQIKWCSSYKRRSYSMISQELFVKLYERLKDRYTQIYFATKEKDGLNHEFVLNLDNHIIKPDFYIVDVKKIIEFDGDYWHDEKRIDINKVTKRHEAIIKAGLKIKYVKECDYRANPEKIVDECFEWIISED